MFVVVVDTAVVCAPNPCYNEAECVPEAEWVYVCKCTAGFEGRHCENKIGQV